MPVCDLAFNGNLDSRGSFRCHKNGDYVLTPTGDIAVVCGAGRLLLQHLILWAATPLGEDLDPKCGCILHKYTFGKATKTNFDKLELELKANIEYNFPEYTITNVRVVSAYDELTDTHGIAVSALFNTEEVTFFADSTGLAELWQAVRAALGKLEYITNAKG